MKKQITTALVLAACIGIVSLSSRASEDKTGHRPENSPKELGEGDKNLQCWSARALTPPFLNTGSPHNPDQNACYYENLTSVCNRVSSAAPVPCSGQSIQVAAKGVCIEGPEACSLSGNTQAINTVNGEWKCGTYAGQPASACECLWYVLYPLQVTTPTVTTCQNTPPTAPGGGD
jgi:hypothetical protein